MARKHVGLPPPSKMLTVRSRSGERRRGRAQGVAGSRRLTARAPSAAESSSYAGTKGRALVDEPGANAPLERAEEECSTTSSPPRAIRRLRARCLRMCTVMSLLRFSPSPGWHAGVCEGQSGERGGGRHTANLVLLRRRGRAGCWSCWVVDGAVLLLRARCQRCRWSATRRRDEWVRGAAAAGRGAQRGGRRRLSGTR